MAIEAAAGLGVAILDRVRAQSLPDMVFFHEINSFLDDEITEFAGGVQPASPIETPTRAANSVA